MEKIEKLKELKSLLDADIITREEFNQLKTEILGPKEAIVETLLPPVEQFKSVIIGKQDWMIENLNVISFRNGEPIPEAKTNEEWLKAGKEGKPAWCNYNNDPIMGDKYGKLYNWYAVNDPRGLAPDGWIIPSNDNWMQLLKNIGMQMSDYSRGRDNDLFTKIKSSTGWAINIYEDGNGTNENGFTALPSGQRYNWISKGNESVEFSGAKMSAFWWSSTEESQLNACDFIILFGDAGCPEHGEKQYGLSVRCLKQPIE